MNHPQDASEQTEQVITLTPKAAKKFTDILQQEKKEGQALRLTEVKGGCSGFKHELGFSASPEENDFVTESCGITIHIPLEQLPRLAGCVIDYTDDLQNPGFKVSNPNAASSCKCGSSHRYEETP